MLLYFTMNERDCFIKNIIKNKSINNNWIHNFSTNCYAYALGIDINENKIRKNAYKPGNISNTSLIDNKIFYNYYEFIKGFYNDLKYLGLEYRRVNNEEKIDANEWKIALMFYYKYFANNYYIINFHFLRQYNNIWYHKLGYFKKPTNRDDKNIIIVNPKDCIIKNYEYKETYALKLKKD